MSKPFNATTRELLGAFPESWLAYVGIDPEGPVLAIDADVSTISAEVDKVLRIEGPEPYLVHIELQASADRTLPRRLWRYNALLDLKHDLRVRSIAILLRPAADSGDLTGVLDLRRPDGGRVVEFHYGVPLRRPPGLASAGRADPSPERGDPAAGPAGRCPRHGGAPDRPSDRCPARPGDSGPPGW
ncbi:MAG: hypothetical protein IRY99_23365 [Isosphaeraceae bacterium]|nr:hypothetical protein [Isosphaeraceae bacterium]